MDFLSMPKMPMAGASNVRGNNPSFWFRNLDSYPMFHVKQMAEKKQKRHC